MSTESHPAAARQKPERGSPPVFHHVNLKTTRKAEMIEWYRTVLEMEVMYDHPAAAWLTNDAANHRVALLAVPPPPVEVDRRFQDGLHHVAFEYPEFEDL